MKTIYQAAVALACVTAMSTYAGAQDRLSDAKGLYDSASYNEALSALNQVSGESDLVEVEKYRALCLLALDRPKDAELSLEHLAMTRPLFTLDGSDAPPKLVAMFRDVRKRTLPEASKQAYQRARASYESGDMAEASRQFRDVLAMVDAAPPENAAMLNDLKMLATGFLKLAETAMVTKPSQPQASAAPSETPRTTPQAATPSATPPVRIAPTVAPKTNPPVPTAASSPTAQIAPAPTTQAAAVYDASDNTVTPPVAIDRRVPTWDRPRVLAFRAFEGLLQVVVGEDGSVLQSTMVKPMNPGYDALLTTAAQKWRFRPATLGGQPVKYRLTYSFNVPPAGR